ncbi:MAG TPA: THUMP domain-containing protein [Prolixibacteraceae bacterium]|nr:THUMP domain-containing protein [Prolixibacteraceae bacterium]
MSKFKLVAKTLAGLENVLADEIRALGGESVLVERRAVSFVGDQEMMYKANFHLRTAIKILKPIAEFEVTNRDELYDHAKEIPWTNYLALGKSFAIDATVQSEMFVNSMFASLRVKDAIADQFREATGKRPSVNSDDPDIRINVHLMNNHCTLSLDSSGDSLHKRGYRIGQGEAPLNEVLAAGMILLTGWHGEKDFFDPMCGSGTLLIEAAMIAKGIPPGMYRKSFGFEQWPDFNEKLFAEIYNGEYEKEFEGKIYGSDISPMDIALAKANVKNASFSKVIELQVQDFINSEPPFANGIIITNPPYGERMKPQSITELYSSVGNTLKNKFAGFEAWIITSSEDGLKSVGLKPAKKIDLFNGALACSFRCFELFRGSHKDAVIIKKRVLLKRSDAQNEL